MELHGGQGVVGKRVCQSARLGQNKKKNSGAKTIHTWNIKCHKEVSEKEREIEDERLIGAL